MQRQAPFLQVRLVLNFVVYKNINFLICHSPKNNNLQNNFKEVIWYEINVTVQITSISFSPTPNSISHQHTVRSIVNFIFPSYVPMLQLHFDALDITPYNAGLRLTILIYIG
jgi:hypothetical protein